MQLDDCGVWIEPATLEPSTCLLFRLESIILELQTWNNCIDLPPPLFLRTTKLSWRSLTVRRRAIERALYRGNGTWWRREREDIGYGRERAWWRDCIGDTVEQFHQLTTTALDSDMKIGKWGSLEMSASRAYTERFYFTLRGIWTISDDGPTTAACCIGWCWWWWCCWCPCCCNPNESAIWNSFGRKFIKCLLLRSVNPKLWMYGWFLADIAIPPIQLSTANDIDPHLLIRVDGSRPFHIPAIQWREEIENRMNIKPDLCGILPHIEPDLRGILSHIKPDPRDILPHIKPDPRGIYCHISNPIHARGLLPHIEPDTRGIYCHISNPIHARGILPHIKLDPRGILSHIKPDPRGVLLHIKPDPCTLHTATYQIGSAWHTVTYRTRSTWHTVTCQTRFTHTVTYQTWFTWHTVTYQTWSPWHIAYTLWWSGGPRFQSHPRLTFHSCSHYQLNSLGELSRIRIDLQQVEYLHAGYQILDFTVDRVWYSYDFKFCCDIYNLAHIFTFNYFP